MSIRFKMMAGAVGLASLVAGPATVASAAPPVKGPGFQIGLAEVVTGTVDINVDVAALSSKGKVSSATRVELELIQIIPDDGRGEGGFRVEVVSFDANDLPATHTFVVDDAAEYVVTLRTFRQKGNGSETELSFERSRFLVDCAEFALANC